MRPLLFCVSDTPKTALIYLKNGPNCCVRFNFGGRFTLTISSYYGYVSIDVGFLWDLIMLTLC